jgi:glycosyltransferase involved in cell wall biosynthesis
MKILIAAYACVPNFGREQGFGWNNALQLASLGHEVWVITLNEPESQQYPKSQLPPTLHFVYVPHPILKNVPQDRFKYLHNLRYFAWKRKAELVASQLDQEHDFDIVHHLTIASLQGGPLFTSLKKPLIFGPVGGGQTAPTSYKKYFFEYWQNESLRSFLNCKFIAFNFLLKGALKRTNLVLATNQETVEIAEKNGAKNVQLFLDSGLPPEYFPPEPPTRLESQELRLLWLSRIELRKGLYLALEALSKVNSAIPFKLSIIGQGPFDSYVNQWIEHFNLETKVEYHGGLPWTKVQDAYLENDVFLFTSLRDSYGSVLLEAMSQALPIITLNHHGARDFVPNKAAIKVPVNNPDETVVGIARAVEYMYENPRERLEMGKASYEFAKKQSWKNKAIAISQYYEEILHSNPKTATTALISQVN